MAPKERAAANRATSPRRKVLVRMALSLTVLSWIYDLLARWRASKAGSGRCRVWVLRYLQGETGFRCSSGHWSGLHAATSDQASVVAEPARRRAVAGTLPDAPAVPAPGWQRGRPRHTESAHRRHTRRATSPAP